MFGLKCYRRNPSHFENFSHPHLEALLDKPNQADQLAKLVQSGADETTIRDQVLIQLSNKNKTGFNIAVRTGLLTRV